MILTPGLPAQAVTGHFHPPCFRCCVCGCLLEHAAYTVDSDNKVEPLELINLN